MLLGATGVCEAQDRGGIMAGGMSLEEMKSEKRLALVIGNGAYKTMPLANPTHDARLEWERGTVVIQVVWAIATEGHG